MERTNRTLLVPLLVDNCEFYFGLMRPRIISFGDGELGYGSTNGDGNGCGLRHAGKPDGNGEEPPRAPPSR